MLINDDSYLQTLEHVKSRIRNARYKAVLGVNREQILLFWDIGKIITTNTRYGAGFVKNLAGDIKLEFPDAKGYSVRNLSYMRKFAEFVCEEGKVQTLSALLSWSHNICLFDKTKTLDEYAWYAAKAIENGWSLSSLVHQIETGLYERQALPDKITNFDRTLAPPLDELAKATLKDPYVFDFIGIRGNIIEREIENELVENIAKTLLELGTGFAFLGNQYHLCVGNEDYYIDLLFYNTRLCCYIAIELKAGKFKPEFTGKLNFYLSAIDDTLRGDHDNPSIGILLCKERDKLTAEYALRDINKPIGVGEYKLSNLVPQELAGALPSVEDIEKRVMDKYKIMEDE